MSNSICPLKLSPLRPSSVKTLPPAISLHYAENPLPPGLWEVPAHMRYFASCHRNHRYEVLKSLLHTTSPPSSRPSSKQTPSAPAAQNAWSRQNHRLNSSVAASVDWTLRLPHHRPRPCWLDSWLHYCRPSLQFSRPPRWAPSCSFHRQNHCHRTPGN